MLLILFVQHQGAGACAGESHASSEVLQLACSRVRCHDDHRVTEVHETTVTIRQSSLVENLQQQVEHVAVGFLYLVEQYDGVGMAAHPLRQLSTLLIADIARRSADQS